MHDIRHTRSRPAPFPSFPFCLPPFRSPRGADGRKPRDFLFPFFNFFSPLSFGQLTVPPKRHPRGQSLSFPSLLEPLSPLSFRWTAQVGQFVRQYGSGRVKLFLSPLPSLPYSWSTDRQPQPFLSSSFGSLFFLSPLSSSGQAGVREAADLVLPPFSPCFASPPPLLHSGAIGSEG